MSYVILPAARGDIDAITDWILSNFGVVSAMKAEQKLFDTFQLLSEFPQMGRPRPELTSRPVLFFSLTPNWIVYAPVEPLRIHRILPARMDLRTLKI